jgi:hypothetical protein
MPKKIKKFEGDFVGYKWKIILKNKTLDNVECILLIMQQVALFWFGVIAKGMTTIGVI